MASGTLIGLINADDELLPETSEILKMNVKNRCGYILWELLLG